MILNSMDKLFPEPRELLEVAGASETGVGHALMAAVRRERDAVDRDTRAHPALVTDGDIRPDLRYRTGYREALEWVLDLERKCQEHRKANKE